MIESVEKIADMGEAPSNAFLLPLSRIGHDDELDEEEFLEFKTHIGSTEFIGSRWIVCGSECFVERHKVKSLNEINR